MKATKHRVILVQACSWLVRKKQVENDRWWECLQLIIKRMLRRTVRDASSRTTTRNGWAAWPTQWHMFVLLNSYKIVHIHSALLKWIWSHLTHLRNLKWRSKLSNLASLPHDCSYQVIFSESVLSSYPSWGRDASFEICALLLLRSVKQKARRFQFFSFIFDL